MKKKGISANPSRLRSRAEEQLKKRKTGPGIPGLEEGTQKLLHELQVHQIELEMQNEELRRAREETEVALSKYTELYEFAPAGYITLSKGGIIREINLTGSNLLDTARSRLINKPLSHFIIDDDRQVFNAFLRNVFEKASKESCEVRLRKEGNQPRFVYIEAKVLTEGQKCSTIVVDITGRRLAEENLRASSARYRSYIEVTGQLGWTTNADGEVVEDLPSWRMYTGQTYEEIRGQGWSEALHPDDVERTLKVWEKAVSEKNNYETDCRIRRHDGIYRHFMVRGIPVLKEDGSIREWVGTCIDITDRNKAGEEIRRLNVELKRKIGELEASNKDWEMFSHAVSHELRSHLFLIDGLSRIVLKKYADKVDVRGREQLTTAMEVAEKMGHLLDDLFAFSRASAVEIKANPDMVNMEEIAKHAFEELKPSIGNRIIQLEMKQLPSCHGDSSLLRQVFVNLFGNAIKFTEPKEIALIEVGGIQKGDDFEF
jgi:PAS domain S-box-containing protein